MIFVTQFCPVSISDHELSVTAVCLGLDVNCCDCSDYLLRLRLWLRARFTNVDQISVQLNHVQRWS